MSGYLYDCSIKFFQGKWCRCLLDASNFSSLVPELGNCFAILPSSIHECLCVPFQSESDLLTFATMVKEVNDTSVSLEDKLTDSVYIWNDGKLSQFLN